MRLWTSTCSRPTCSANSLRIGKVATTLTEAAWAVGGWMRARRARLTASWREAAASGGTVAPSLFKVNERGILLRPGDYRQSHRYSCRILMRYAFTFVILSEAKNLDPSRCSG